MKTSKEQRSKLSASSYELPVRQGRNLVAAAIFILLAGLSGIGLYLYNYFELQIAAWQVTVSVIGVAFPLLGAVLVFWLARLQKYTLGVWVLIFATWVGIVIVSVVISNAGQILSLTTFVFTIGLGALALPQRAFGRVIILGVFVRFLLELLMQYLSAWQFVIPGLENFVVIVAVFTLLAFGLLIAWQFRTLSLTNKLVLVFLALTLAGATIITYNTEVTTTTALRDNVGSGLKAQTDAQARLIGDMLQQEITSLRALATSEILREAAIQANATYPADEAQIQAEIAALDTEWINKAKVGDTAGTLFSSRLDNETAGELQEFRRILSDNVEVFLTDQYGALVATTNVTSDYAQGDEEWWQSAYNQGWGAVYVSSPEYDESSRSMSILLAVPVVSADTGKLVGVLRSTYIIDPIVRSLGFVKLGETGGLDIYFPGTVTSNIREGKLALVDSQQIEPLQLVEGKIYGEIYYDSYTSLVSRSTVISSVQDPAIDNLGWFIVAHQHSEEALAAVIQQTRNSRLLVAVIVVVVSLGAIWLARAITGPIVRLNEFANRVREGDLNVVAHSETSDEVGTLAETFNQMTGQIRQMLSGLEQQISERTRELTLSAEVGRSLSQVRDLDLLLNQAVELIQFSFDLYYTQVYLVDPAGRSLILRAGTGDVGVELLRRRHRLPVGPGSMNGLAVAEQRPILVSDTEKSPVFRPNPLLPETRSELSVPLMVGERVVGVLDMQSSRAGALSEENLAAFETLAGQVAIAIENAGLITQAEHAREDVEQQARRLSAQGWIEYLDAIQHSEKMGYVFDGESVEPITTFQPGVSVSEDAASTEILTLPVTLLGQTLGHISLEREAQKAWSQSDRELVETVSGQVARQIENLRLLAQAEQYRLEAEESARRLTREGWEGYLESTVRENEYQYIYDHQRVQEYTPEAGSANEDKAGEEIYIQPVQVRDVVIGELALEGSDLDDEGRRLVEFVAERLGEHIENLRLAGQTAAALASTESLYAGSEAIVRSRTATSVLQSIVAASALNQFDHSSIMLFDTPRVDRMPDSAEVVGAWERANSQPNVLVGTHVPMAQFRYVSMLQRGQPFFIADLQAAEQVDERRRDILAGLGRSIILIPLVAADQWLGWLAATSDAPVYLTEAQLRQVQSLVGQASAVVQGIRLLQQSELRARREQTLRQVAERLRSTVDPEQVMRLAVKEVGEVLGRNVLIRLGVSPAVEETASDGKHSPTQSDDKV